jgi:hypothetical protein
VGLGNVDNTADTAKSVASATKLTTARKIGGVSFDGTADINLPGVNAAGTQSTTGNAATATKLATARTLSVTGDGTASGSFDGSANLALALVLAATGVTAGTYRSVTVDAKGRVTGGTNPTTLSEYGITDAVALSDLENNFGESGYKGYQKLPGGLIMQWNLEQVSDSGTYVTFPVSFPHQLYTLVATPRSTTPGRVYVASFSKVNAELVNDISEGSLVFWIAIGS